MRFTVLDLNGFVVIGFAFDHELENVRESLGSSNAGTVALNTSAFRDTKKFPKISLLPLKKF